MRTLSCEPRIPVTVAPLFIVGNGEEIADFAAHITATGSHRPVVVQPSSFAFDAASVKVVVFLGSQLGPEIRSVLDSIGGVAPGRICRVCLVSSFRTHLADRAAIELESYAVDRLAHVREKVVVFRPGHLLSPRSTLTGWLRKLSWCWPFIPARLTSCCIDGAELFSAIERELGRSGGRTFTLLGPNRSWRERLRDNQRGGAGHQLLTTLALLLQFLFVGQLLALLIARLRGWHVDTLVPATQRELLALMNYYNYRYVKCVGFNNGVIHFGQCHTGKTVVSTAGCNRVGYVHGDRAKFDGGVTVRQATDVLAAAGKELHVVPNYSYVCLGTAFFVPIHGSASAYSTLGDTIVKAVLYDPVDDRIIVATRGSPAFGEYLYNLRRTVVLLRLYLQVKEKSRYYVQKQILPVAQGTELLAAFHDPRPSNVEVRKARAASQEAVVYRYYNQSEAGDAGTALEFPRDAVGRMWDRLHVNPLTSALFHGLTRYLAYHVEVFFTEEEFVVFWETHRHLPIAKIQLRFIKCDGQPHSPFREHACVSADLFMLKRHKAEFDRYMRETFRHAQFNPGKHSM